MPVWVLNLIISTAIKFGVPWILRRFNLPEDVGKIVTNLINDLKDIPIHKVGKRVSRKKKALAEIKTCTVACAPELKTDT